MLNYLLEVSLCWLGFYLLYVVWLSKETFFHLNRWYLLVTLLLGLVIPFAEMPTDTTAVHPAWNYLETVTITVQQAEAEVATIVAAPLSTNWSVQDIMLWVYGIGVFWMSVRFVFGLAQIYRCYAGSTREEHAAYTVLYNKDIPLPFSFFHYLFLNASANYTATERDSIIRHELVHIKGRHRCIVGRNTEYPVLVQPADLRLPPFCSQCTRIPR
jgi:bla regulator protein blaR1